jgi:hypothetical protein
VALAVAFDDGEVIAETRLRTAVDEHAVGRDAEPPQRPLHRQARGAADVQPLDLPGRRGTDADGERSLADDLGELLALHSSKTFGIDGAFDAALDR